MAGTERRGGEVPCPPVPRQDEAFCHAIVQTVPDGLIVINDAGLIQSFNAIAEKQFGYRAAAVIGRNVKMLMPRPYSDHHDGYLERYRATGERRVIGIGRVVLGQRADGSTFPLELRIGEFYAEGRRFFAGYVRDITQRQRDRDRMQELQAELFRAARFSVTGEMASALAHELNQPLTALISYVRACVRLLDQGHFQLLREIMDKALGQANRAGQIIRHLREFLGTSETVRTIESINEVVEESITLAMVGAREEGVNLRLEMSSDLPEVVIDRIQVQQVVLNLVRNALEALEGQQRREITVSTSLADETSVAVAISDSGPGLPEEVESRLFQPFVTTKTKGMGLGLTICHSIVDAHGGRLRALPNADGGMTFRFTLPTISSTD